MRSLIALLAGGLGLAIFIAGHEPGKAEQAAPPPWWSLRPLVKSVPPPVQVPGFESWARNPIDQFILARLADKGLTPSPPADKRTLLRRVTFDLTGLPPTLEELADFEADDSPYAYERVVDRLLASPHHGERWARHWMDVVHFAETHGHDQDRPRPNAWPYRDYLIRSLNADKPYARFVQEQIAGDVLFPDDPQGIVATGLLAAGPWDESSLLNIMEDTVDKKIARYLDRDDMITTLMSAITSTTVHCARCHEHKFDPIPQADYYALQAVLAGVDRAERPFDPDSNVHARRKALVAERKRLETLQGKADPSLLESGAQAEAARWEQLHAARALVWTPLDPQTFTSANGATLTRLPDGSVLSGGMRPATDVTTITAQTLVKGITGLRVEVLTDPSLPLMGPGRQDNGNLHLNEIRVTASAAGGQPASVPLQNPTADHDQQGWTIAMAIDGNPKTAWGIYPNVGQPHQAVFEFREPLAGEGSATLTIVLEQTHGGGHLIGRVRLAITNAPRPLSAHARPLPAAISAILTTQQGQRTDSQRAELARFALLQSVEEKLARLPTQQMVYAAASDFKPEGNFRPAGMPRPIHVLRRGDVNKPGDPAEPGALECIPGLPARFALARPEDEGARRAALAHWLTDPKNVLTWRSIANRVWHYHIGRGIVDTPNDLGRMGGQPSHAELLDWLAVNLQEQGGSLKQLHRLIVTSATYRQSSVLRQPGARVDGDNRFLWRMNASRLDAESVKDAVLLISGKLDRTMGGPSVKQFIQSPGIHVTPNVDYVNFKMDDPANHRRCVYRFLFRTLPDPFMESLDCPDSSQLAPARTTSVSALQALSMLNNPFIIRQSEHLAARVASCNPAVQEQVRQVYRLVLLREPTDAELEMMTTYASRHGLANTCRVVLNSNEFMFVP